MRARPLLIIFLFACAPARAEEKKSALVGSVVRSREYVLRRAPRKQEEFIGDVSYRRAARSVRADWALYEHKSDVWKLRGNIRGEDRLRDGSLLSVQGHEAIHNVKTGFGELRPRGEDDTIRLTRAWNKSMDRATARSLFWDEKDATIRLEGDVRLESPLASAAAQSAVYCHADRSLTLMGGRPFIAPREQGWSAAAQADEIRATEQPQKIRSVGSVLGWLYFPPEASDGPRTPAGTRGLWFLKPRKK